MSVKRPASPEVSGISGSKYPRSGYYYVLESESDLPTDEDSESVHSIQGKETDFAKDTSDTTSHSDCSNDMKFEYEVASLSEKENPLGDGSLSSGSEDMKIQCATAAVMVIDGILEDFTSTLADNSENSDSSQKFDPEVPRADYWTCLQCKNTNNNPLFRYCEKCYKRRICVQCKHFKKLPCFPCCDHCFKLRKNFFPPRPSKKRRKSNKKSSLEKSASNASTVSIASCSSVSQKTDLIGIPGPSNPLHCDSGLGSSQESFFLSDKVESQLCITCLINPKNGIFVHKRVGHICCCYSCALKVWTQTGRCPICNCRVSKVLKAVVQ